MLYSKTVMTPVKVQEYHVTHRSIPYQSNDYYNRSDPFVPSVVLPALNSCFFVFEGGSVYCCSGYEVKDHIGYAEDCVDMSGWRLMRGDPSLP
jgi:hypothetical protein